MQRKPLPCGNYDKNEIKAQYTYAGPHSQCYVGMDANIHDSNPVGEKPAVGEHSSWRGTRD